MDLREEDGITLVEIMLTLVILSIVLSAMFSVIIGGLQSLSESRARQTASQVATEQIETLRTLAPSEVAMYNDPLVSLSAEFDPATVVCGGTAGTYDPDGAGPLGCETVATLSLGAVTSDLPWQGERDGVTVETIVTEATGTGVPAGAVRVTVVSTYEFSDGVEEVRRSALFSEVARG